jgi:hypothetical protein
MQTIDLSDGRVELEDLLRLASENSLILRTVDGDEFVLAKIDDLAKEIEWVGGQEELTAFLEERSQSERTFTIDEARKMLELD